MKVKVFDNLEAHELSIDTHGLNFLCIFGEHVNGGFISVMNWNVSAEISFNSFEYSCHVLALVLYGSSIGDRFVCDEIASDIITAVFECLGCLDSELPCHKPTYLEYGCQGCTECKDKEEDYREILRCPKECPWFDATTKGCQGCNKRSDCPEYVFMEDLERTAKLNAEEGFLERIIPEDELPF